MISSRAKRILSIKGEKISIVRGNTDGVTYFVRQGQKEVIEENGDGRNRIILVSNSRSQL
jgi:hypothetical protein